MLKDTFDLKGYFKIEVLKNNQVIDEYEDKNLVVLSARKNMAKMVAGQSILQPITRLVIGVDGYKNDILTPLSVGEAFTKSGVNYVFDENRTKIISEEANDYYYTVNFTPSLTGGNATNISGKGSNESTSNSNDTVSINVNNTAVTYTITIKTTSANNDGYVPFTEAGLYFKDTDNVFKLFAMKTFRAKIKDESSELRITWTIYF